MPVLLRGKRTKMRMAKPQNGGVFFIMPLCNEGRCVQKADAFKSVTMSIEGWCSFGAKRTKSMGVSIPPYPLNDLAGAWIATGVRWRQGSGFVLRFLCSAPRDVIVRCAPLCGTYAECEQCSFASAAHGEAAKRRQSGAQVICT